ncbi:hypothetical protein ACJJTC_001166 [Scirpophaga incertulas]
MIVSNALEYSEVSEKRDDPNMSGRRREIGFAPAHRETSVDKRHKKEKRSYHECFLKQRINSNVLKSANWGDSIRVSQRGLDCQDVPALDWTGGIPRHLNSMADVGYQPSNR